MNFRDWIYAFVNHVPDIIARPARYIADRLYAILTDGIKFARWIGNGATALAAKGVYYVALVLGFAVEVYLTLQWLASIEIPRRVAGALTAAQKWATPIIASVKNTLTAALNDLRQWAIGKVNALLNAINIVSLWAQNQVAVIKAFLANTVGVWYDRMTHPDKFAEWIIGAIVKALLRYAFSNRDRLARWLLTDSPVFTVWLARQLQGILGRVL